MSTVHEIGRYQLTHYYLPPPNVLSPVARLSLFAPSDLMIGTVDFIRVRDGLNYAPSTYDEIGEQIQAVMHHDQLHDVIDTLRNERPCFIRWTYYSSADLYSVSIATGEEPVGEEETSPKLPGLRDAPMVLEATAHPALGTTRCCLCGKQRPQVESLISGARGAICGECVVACSQVVESKND